MAGAVTLKAPMELCTKIQGTKNPERASKPTVKVAMNEIGGAAKLQCRHDAAQTPRRLRAAEKALACSVEALCKALAQSSQSQRRLAIERLPMALRLELIHLRQAQRTVGACWREVASPPTSVQTSVSDSAEKQVAASTTNAKVRASEEALLALRSARVAKQTTVKRKIDTEPKGNVWTVKNAGGVYYKIRLALGRVLITSRRFSCVQMANMALDELRSAAKVAAPSAHASDSVEAQLRGIAATGMSGNFELLFQVVLDVRRWLGHRIYSKPFNSVAEALAMRHQVLEAESTGSVALCELWRKWARAEWHVGGRARRPSDAEAAVMLDAAVHRAALHSGKHRQHGTKRQTTVVKLSSKLLRADRRVLRQERVASRRWKCLSKCIERAEAALARRTVVKTAPCPRSSPCELHTCQQTKRKPIKTFEKICDASQSAAIAFHCHFKCLDSEANTGGRSHLEHCLSPDSSRPRV